MRVSGSVSSLMTWDWERYVKIAQDPGCFFVANKAGCCWVEVGWLAPAQDLDVICIGRKNLGVLPVTTPGCWETLKSFRMVLGSHMEQDVPCLCCFSENWKQL